MSSENRFSNLMGGLKGSEEPESKPAAKKTRKKKQPLSRLDGKAATAKQPGEPKIRREPSTPLAKSKDPDYEKGTYYLPKDLTHEMRIYAASRKLQMSDLAEAAIRQYLKKHPLK